MATNCADHVTNSVPYGKKLYATLDCVSPGTVYDSSSAKQTQFLPLPDGWSLAQWSEDLGTNVISKFQWGATRLVLANGDAYATSAYRQNRTGLLGNGFLLRDESGRVKPKVNAGTFPRVLICIDVGVPKGIKYCVDTLSSLWDTREFADCEVECDGEVFKCHRALLAQASPVFKQMFAGEMLEAKSRKLQIETTDAQAVSAFLKFIYTGSLDCDVNDAISVAKLADFYQVDSLVQVTCTAMFSEIGKDNVVIVHRFMQSMRERPQFVAHWEKLVDMVSDSKELTRALMIGM